jgi:RND family efflux transporter MFP subunit
VEPDWVVISMELVNAHTVHGRRMVTGTCVLLCLLAGCDGKRPEPAPAPVAQTPAPMAAVASPAVTDSGVVPREYTTTGPLVVEQQANVLAERDGLVVGVRAELGQRVGRDQVLALLDDRSLQAAYASKAARLESLRAQTKEWEAEQHGNEADMRRSDSLFASQIVSEEDHEHTRSKLDQTIAEVSRYESEVTGAEADLRAAKIDIEDSRIVAPFAGVVGRRSVHEGQDVKKGDALFWITAEGPLHIVFTVPESAMTAFRAGTMLDLTTSALPSLHQKARVMHVSPVVDPASGSIEVNGLLERPAPGLKPGMSMQVRLAR